MKIQIDASPELVEQLQRIQAQGNQIGPLGIRVQSLEVLGDIPQELAVTAHAPGAPHQPGTQQEWSREEWANMLRSGGKGAEAALKRMYQYYSGPLLRESFILVRDPQIATDLVQETFLTAWRRFESFRGDGELYPWLRKILRHKAIDMLRTNHREISLEEADQNTGLRETKPHDPWSTSHNATENAASRTELEAVFRRCAERFSQEQPQAAAVIRWVTEDGLSPEDVAQLLDRSPGAAREYISQCRKKARVYFAEWYKQVLLADK